MSVSVFLNRLVWAFCLCPLFTADAATRTVTFIGMARMQVDNLAVHSAALDLSECVINVSNMSSVPQTIVSVGVLKSAPTAGGDYNTTFSSVSGLAGLYGATGSTDGCVGQTLQPFSTCLMQFPLQLIDFAGGSVVQCTGKISVRDSSVTTSGSVIAMGAVQTLQEAQVLGGTLAGAYYASNALRSGGTHNMNLSCSQACMQSRGDASTSYADGRWSPARCRAHCGTVDIASVGSSNASDLIRFWNWGTLLPPKASLRPAYSPSDPTTVWWGAGTPSFLSVSGVLRNSADIGNRPSIGGLFDPRSNFVYHLLPQNEYTSGGILRPSIGVPPGPATSASFSAIDAAYNDSRSAFGIVGLDAFSVMLNTIIPFSAEFRNTSSIDGNNCRPRGPAGRCSVPSTNITGFTDTEYVSEPSGRFAYSTQDNLALLAPDANGPRHSPFGPHTQNYYTRTAEARFAGGMVYEMSIGAFASICDANETNGRSLDANVNSLTDNNSRYQPSLATSHNFPSDPGDGIFYEGHGGAGPVVPESLYCHHRHQLPDLFMKVGQSYPFVINGGQPF